MLEQVALPRHSFRVLGSILSLGYSRHGVAHAQGSLFLSHCSTSCRTGYSKSPLGVSEGVNGNLCWTNFQPIVNYPALCSQCNLDRLRSHHDPDETDKQLNE